MAFARNADFINDVHFSEIMLYYQMKTFNILSLSVFQISFLFSSYFQPAGSTRSPGVVAAVSVYVKRLCRKLGFHKKGWKVKLSSYSEPCCEKKVFEVSDLVRHKPGCAVTEDGQSLEISDLGSRVIALAV